MPTDTTPQDITAEIRDIFDTKVGHFADKSARWLFRQTENVQGLIRRNGCVKPKCVLASIFSRDADMTLKLTRRQFIQRTALTGLSIGTGAALSGCDPLETVIAPPTPVETADEVPALIIGSGFGGAVAALRLGKPV